MELDAAPSEVGQTLAVLAASGEGDPRDLSLGEGDRLLLDLCRTITQTDLEVVAACPACGELSEARLTTADVPAARPRMARLGVGGGLRAPTYGDLCGLPPDAGDAIQELLARCVVGTPSRAPTVDDLERVDDSLAGPIEMACAACGGPIAVDIDIEQAVLERLDRRAREIAVEVHLLASAYHWSLSEIESLDDRRRETLARLVVDSR